MNPSRGGAGRRSRGSSRSSLRFEALERRLPLAGNVTAQVVGSTLRLTGDSLGNDVVVASAAGGRIAVIGQATTINGSAAAFVTNRAFRSIVADLNGGDDAIGFGNSAQGYAYARTFIDATRMPLADPPPAPFDVASLQAAINQASGGVATFSIPGSLTVVTAGGDDAVAITGDVGGSVDVSLGSAGLGNGLVIGGESTPGRIGGGVIVKGGNGNDLVAIGNVSVAGLVSAALGDGLNWMVVGGEADTPANIAGISYTGGADMDIVGLFGDVTVRNDVRIVTGSRGEDSVGLYRSDAGGVVKVLGNVVVDTGPGGDGDTVDLVGEIRGAASVTTGGGRDTVCVSASVGWLSSDGSDPVPAIEAAGPSTIGLGLTIATGAGNDLIAIGVSAIGRNATIHAGSGRDDVRIDSMRVRSGLIVRLGAGDDALTITNTTAFAAWLYGGGGINVLSTGAATPAVARGLRVHQFQAGSTA